MNMEMNDYDLEDVEFENEVELERAWKIEIQRQQEKMEALLFGAHLAVQL